MAEVNQHVLPASEQVLRNQLLQLFSVAAEAVEEHRETTRCYLRNFVSNPTVSADTGASALRHAMAAPNGHHSVPFSEYLDFLFRSVVPESSNMYSPRCIGHMTSAVPGFMWPLSDLVIGLNQNLVKREASRSLTVIERLVLATLHKLVYGRDEAFYQCHTQDYSSTLGILNSGATTSNLTALWIARNTAFGGGECAGVEEVGLAAALERRGCHRAVIVCSSFAHYSIQKAAGILGIGEQNVLSVAVDRRGRISLKALEETIKSCRRRGDCIVAVVGTAGTTDCGSIDSLTGMAALAHDAGAHFHVDAAWGAPLLFSRRFREKLAGIDLADSVTIDAHKQLYVPIGNSILVLRSPMACRVIEKQTRYMLHEDSGDLGKRSLEGSRSGWALLLHAGLQVIGSQGYGFLAEENIRRARLLSSKLRNMPDFELLVPPETNIVLYRYVPVALRQAASERTLAPAQAARLNELNERIQKVQSERGLAFVSRTTVHMLDNGPVVALRAVFGNPLVTEGDIDFVLADQIGIAESLACESFCAAATRCAT